MTNLVFMAALAMPLATLTPCDQATAPIACEITDPDQMVNTFCPIVANGTNGWCIEGICQQQCGQDENRCLFGTVQWVQHYTLGGACYCTAQ